jgi:hypothetical protein
LYDKQYILLNANPLLTAKFKSSGDDAIDDKNKEAVDRTIGNLKVHMEGDLKLSFVRK